MLSAFQILSTVNVLFSKLLDDVYQMDIEAYSKVNAQISFTMFLVFTATLRYQTFLNQSGLQANDQISLITILVGHKLTEVQKFQDRSKQWHPLSYGVNHRNIKLPCIICGSRCYQGWHLLQL